MLQQAISLGALHSLPRDLIPEVDGEVDRLPVSVDKSPRTVGRAETPAMRARATEKKVEGFIVIVVRCS